MFQSPGAEVGAPIPTVGDDQPPLPAGVLAPEVGAHQGPGAEIGKTWEHLCCLMFISSLTRQILT